MKRNIYTKHFGFPNCMILFITTSEARMQGMMQLVKEIIGDASWLLFSHTKDWSTEPNHPAPPLDLMTRRWKRNGHKDFRLDRFEEM